VATKVLMPKLGLTMTEGKIVRWIKQEGDPVKKGEPLLEIMTEKIVTEVESPGSGILVKIFHSTNAVVPITEVIALLAEKGEDWSAAAAEFGHTVDAPVVAEKTVEKDVEKLVDSGSEPILPEKRPDEGTRLKVSPLARRIAEEKGITKEELRIISGSGPSGRIVKKDILAYSERPAKKTAVSAAQQPSGGRVEPLSDLRGAIARRMTQSFTTTPHFYLEAEADVVSMLEMRSKINEILKKDNESVSINDILVKITAAALARHPFINASYSDQGITVHDQVNVGVAVALESGLIVPVIRDASAKGLREIAQNSRTLIEKARNNSLALDDITGGTFTLSNLGMFTVDAFTAIINPPEAAILAVGRVVEKPVCIDGEVVVRKRITLTLSLDHRVLDGAQGARFLGEIVNYIENPFLLL
jgi:pyruvate dehydrogenase E2 component (dihydrolipoamide acetyltransferase)